MAYYFFLFQLMEGSLAGWSLVIVARPVDSGGNAVFGPAPTLPPLGWETPEMGDTQKQRSVKALLPR